MKRLRLVVIVGCLVTTLATAIHLTGSTPYAANAQAATAPARTARFRSMLTKNCASCHNRQQQSGGIALDNVDLSKVVAETELWESVERQLRMGHTTPVGKGQEDKTTQDAFAAWLESTLDNAALINPNPGPPTVHRLNRLEYGNAIRDLLNLTIDVTASLPPDDTNGSDNLTESAVLSPSQTEQYASVAQMIIRAALAQPKEGEKETPSRSRIFICQPSDRFEDRCARMILTSLARRAFRRPLAGDRLSPITQNSGSVVDGAVIDTVLRAYKEASAGKTFRAGIEAGLARILVDPLFLFRIEREPADLAPGTAYPISDVEYASRLSFFFWRSIPDESLAESATENTVKFPKPFDHQIQRLLTDARSNALIDSLAAEWTDPEQPGDPARDKSVHPEGGEAPMQASRRETQVLLEAIVRENRSVMELRKTPAMQPDVFARMFAEKLVSYALGRPVGHFDGPSVRSIVRQASRDDYRFKAFLTGTIKSTPFQMRRATGGTSPQASPPDVR